MADRSVRIQLGFLALAGVCFASRGLPRPWPMLLLAACAAAAVGLLVYAIRSGPVSSDERLRRAGKCDCGYDLRGAPALETSRHFFDVWKRMGSTRKIVVCPECGKKHKLWEHD